MRATAVAYTDESMQVLRESTEMCRLLHLEVFKAALSHCLV